MDKNPTKGLRSIPSYIKNVTKSTMYAGGDFLGDIMPASKSFAESNSKVFKTITSDIRNFRTITKQVGRQMGQSEMYTTAKKYKNNLAEDLKSGNWVNKTREDKYNLESSGFGDLFDTSDFDFSFDEEGDGDSLGLGSVTKGDALTVNAIENSSSGMINMTSSVGQAIAETTAKSSEMITKNQQNIYTMNTVNNYRMFNEINGVLSDMGNNLRGLFAYTKNTTEFYNSTLKLNEDMSNRMLEMVALNKETTEMQRNKYKEYNKSKETTYGRSKHEDVFNAQGGMDLAKYGEYVGKNIKTEWEGSMAGSQMNMFGDSTNPLLAFAGSPLSFLPKMLMKKLAPKGLKSSMGNLDKTVAGFSKSAMLKMSSNLKQKGESNPIFDTIYKILGVDVGTSSSMKTGQYVKGAVPLDGIMRQTLVEVIPSYLRVIAAAVSGGNEKAYNYESGKFEELAAIVKRKDTVNNGAYNKVDDTAYKVKSVMDQSFEFDKDMNKVIKGDTDKFFKFLADKGFFYNPRQTTYGDMNEAGLYLENDKSFEVIQGIMKTLGPNTWQELNEQIIDTVEYSKSYFKDINAKLTESGLSSVENGLTDPKNIGKNQFKPIDKFNKTALDYIRDIRSILLEGIKVFVSGNTTGTETNEASILKDRMMLYKESLAIPKAIDVEVDHDKNEARAKKDGKKYVTSFEDIDTTDPAKLESYLASKYNPNAVKRVSEEEQKAIDLKNSVSNTSIGKSFGKLKNVGKEILTAPGKVVSNLLDSINGHLVSFLYGNKDGEKQSLFESIGTKINSGIDKVSGWLNDKIVEPLNQFLFDPTTGIATRLKMSFGGLKAKAFGSFADGKSDGGWFSPIVNGFMDTKDMIANTFIGKEYTSRLTGAKIGKRETTIFGEIKGMFGKIVASVKGDDKGGPSLKDKIFDKIQISLGSISNSLFGTDLEKMKPSEMYNTHIKPRISKMGMGAVAGLGLSLISPLGLVGGTLLGGSLGTLSTSERFKTKMFGSMGEDGSRKGGVMPKKYMDTIKKAMPSVYKGIGMGALATMFSPFGLLGTSLLGGGIGFASSTEAVKGVLFGKMGADGSRDDTSALIKKEFRDKLKIKLPGMKKGAGLGILGSFFLPGGPIAGAVLGLSAGIASQSSTVKNMLFGELDPETEKRNGGLFGKLKMWFKADIAEPMKAFMGDMKAKGLYWFKKAIANPLMDALDPIKKQAEIMKDVFLANIKSGFESTKEFVGGVFEKHVGKPFGELIEEKFINPLKTFFKNTFGKLGKAFLGVLAAPFAGINKVAMGYKDQHIKDGKADYLDSWKEKKKKRDTDTESEYKESRKKVKGDNARLKLIKKLMIAGNYDPNHPATIKAMSMISSDKSGIKNPFKGNPLDGKATNVNDAVSSISENTNTTNDILGDIKGWLKNLFNFDKTSKSPEGPMGKIKDLNTTDLKIKSSKLKEPGVIDLDDDVSSPARDTSSPALLLKIYSRLDALYKPTKVNKNRSTGTRGKNSSIDELPDDSEEGESRNKSKITPIKNPAKSISSSMQNISDKTDSIYSEIKGQITNVGYNTEMIANILTDQFGAPSMMPKGIRGGMHLIKSKLGGPLRFIKNLLASPFKAIGALLKPVTSIVGEIIKSMTAIPKAILGVVGEVAKGAATLLNTAFKAIPAIINMAATAVIETTKVLGTVAVEFTKGVGSALRMAGEAVGDLTVGILKFTMKALPMAFSAIGALVKTSMSVLSGLTSMAGSVIAAPFKMFSKKGKNGNNSNVIDTISNIKNIENIKFVETVGTVNKIESLNKINDPKLFEALDSITKAVGGKNTPPPKHEDNNSVSAIAASVSNAGENIIGSVNKVMAKVTKKKNIESIDKFNDKEKKSEDELNKKKTNIAVIEGAKADKGTFELLKEGFGKKGTLGKIIAIATTAFGIFKTMGMKIFNFLKGGKLFSGLLTKIKGSTLYKGMAKFFGKEIIEEGVKAGGKAAATAGATTIVKKGGTTLAANAVEAGVSKTANASLNKVATNAGKAGATKVAGEVLETGIKSTAVATIDNTVAGLGKAGATKVAGEVIEAGAKSGSASIITKIFASSAMKKLCGSSIGKFLVPIGKAIMERMKKAGAKIFAKIATEWAVVLGTGAVTAGIVPAIWYGGTILNGISATNKYFEVSPNYKPSALMRTIAGVSAFISQRVSFGFIPESWICKMIASLVLSDKEKEEIGGGNDSLKQEHEAYIAESGKEITLGDYNAKVANRSMMTKAWDGTKDAGNFVTAGVFDSEQARNIYGLEKDADVSMGQHLGTAAANSGSALTLGIVSPKEMHEAYASMGKKTSELYGKTKDFVSTLDDKFLDAMDSTNATMGAIFGLTDDEGNPLNLTDWAKGKFKGMGESIKNMASSATKKAKEIWSGIGDTYNKTKENYKKGLSVFDTTMGVMFGLTDENGNSIKMTDWLGDKAKSAMDGVTNLIDGAMNGAKEVWGGISSMYDKAKGKVAEGAGKLNNKLGKLMGLEDEEGESTSVSGWVSNKWNGLKTKFNTFKEDEIDTRKKRGGKGGESGSGMTGADTKNGAAYFSQHDSRWGSHMYLPSENMSQAGCGPTTAAMVLSSVTGQTVTPLDVANYSVEHGYMDPNAGTSWGLFPDLGQKYGIGLNKVDDYSAASTAMSQGRPVIFSGQGGAPYTSGGHFVMGVGMTPDGQVIINDPNKSENSIAYDYDTFLSSTQGAWVSDKSLTGGVVSSGGSGVIDGEAGKEKETEDGGNPFLTAIGQIGELTSGVVGSVMSGEVFDATKILSPEGNNSTASNGSGLEGFTPISSDMDFNFGSIAPVGTSNNNNKTYGRDAIRSTPGGNDAFINAIAPQAIKNQEEFGIPASTVISQAILESGWGASTIGNNIFGIKEGSGYSGPVVSTKTQENVGGDNVSIVDTFRGYNSISEGMYDHSKNVIAGNPQYYSGVISKDWRQSIRGLVPSYATDPEYVSKLESTITANNLTKYNSMSSGGKGGRGGDSPKSKCELLGGKGKSKFMDYKKGGKGGNIEVVKQQRIDMQQVIANSLRDANNDINDVLTAQSLMSKSGNNIPYEMMIKLLQQITDNTAITAQNTREIADKEYSVNVEQQHQNIKEDVQNDEQDKNKTNTKESGFSKLLNRGGNKSGVGNAYTKAREYAVGLRN